MSNIHPKNTLSSHCVSFAATCALAALASLGPAVPSISFESPNENALRICAAQNLTVEPDALTIIEKNPTSGFKADPLWREALFLGAFDPSQTDLFRAEVQLDVHRRIIGLRELKNLTNSPAGADGLLTVSAPYAAVATRALGQIRSLTLFDLSDQPLPSNAEWTPFTRFLARLSELYETGHLLGVGQTTIRFVYPPNEVKFAFVSAKKKPFLSIRWIDRKNQSHQALIDPASPVSNKEDLIVTKQVRLPKRPILWAVDTVRSFEWVGPGPVEWLEGRFFALMDAYRRALYRFENAEPAADETKTAGKDASAVFKLPAGIEVGQETAPMPWPPGPVVPPVFSRLREGEGQWTPDIPKFDKAPAETSPLVYRTFVRPDLDRPYVRVHLFAMDMRRLELHMVAGLEDPRPTTGSGGEGRFPLRAELLSRIAIAFNGAFKTEHGAYGMMVERNVLVPPKDEAATIASFADGKAAMGSWPAGTPIPGAMISFRQNMDPLVENHVVNPRRRYLWGFTLDEDITQMYTIRSGICMTEAGMLIYAWGEDLTAKTLGVAMNAAGCVYGMHLDMNPFHTAFIHYRFAADVDPEQPEFEAELAIPEMRYSEYRYVRGASKDFFFLAKKDPTPGLNWISKGLAQPAPAVVPAVFRQDVDGAVLIAADLSRLAEEIVPGEISDDLVADKTLQSKTGSLENALVLAELGAWDPSRGQLVRGAIAAALQADRATLAVADDGTLHIGDWPVEAGDPALIDEAVQSRWLLRNGEVVADAQKIVAIGLARADRLIIGVGMSTELARAMRRQGVRDALTFSLQADDPGVMVRRQDGLADLNGNPVTKLDPIPTYFTVVARPTPLGMTRLEAAIKQIR